MNRYIRAAVCVPFGVLKFCFTKCFHPKSFMFTFINMVSPNTEITIDRGAKLSIGKMFKMRGGAKIRIRKGAECNIGNNTSVNHNCMIVCHEKILIGNDVQFSPNVHIYDHDHDYRAGMKNRRYTSTQVIIGNNVWIGSNTIILRGSQIGNNCVIGSGCVIKGEYSDNTIIIQKRIDEVISYLE